MSSHTEALLSKDSPKQRPPAPRLHSPDAKLPGDPGSPPPRAPHTHSEQLLQIVELSMDVAAHLGSEKVGGNSQSEGLCSQGLS